MEIKEQSIHKQRALLAAQVIKNLQRRRYEAYFCATKEEALEKALSLIPEGSSVAWGGSLSVVDIGLVDGIKKTPGLKIIDRDQSRTWDERMEKMRQSLLCDVYFSSTNALSEDGILVNVDWHGNRVAAQIFGPRSVVMIVGMNKVCKTREEAWSRARNYAAPINIFRILGDAQISGGAEKNTPCAKTGTCSNCISEDCICSYIVETRVCRFPGRIKIILVGEELGF